MAGLPQPVLPRVGALLRLLGSDVDGEALGAARALQRTLGGVGLDLNDLAGFVESAPSRTASPPHSPRAVAGRGWGTVGRIAIIELLQRHADHPALTSWEVCFASSMIALVRIPDRSLSERQADTLNSIIAKIAGGAR